MNLVLRKTRKTELPSAALTRLFPASLGARTAPFALLRNTRKTELPSAALTRVFLPSFGARTASFALFWTVLLLQAQHQNHPPRSAGEYAKVLENPARDAWQKPHEVVTALALRPEEAVADIGAGSGYFSRRLAHHAGKVYAVDIDAKLLEMTKANSPANVETVLSTANDPKLAAGSVDTIFFCDVLHHIAERPAYYAKLDKALRPGGRIVMIDFYKRDLPVGPPVAMKLSEEKVTAEMQAAGFVLSRRHDMLPHQYS